MRLKLSVGGPAHSQFSTAPPRRRPAVERPRTKCSLLSAICVAHPRIRAYARDRVSGSKQRYDDLYVLLGQLFPRAVARPQHTSRQPKRAGASDLGAIIIVIRLLNIRCRRLSVF